MFDAQHFRRSVTHGDGGVGNARSLTPLRRGQALESLLPVDNRPHPLVMGGPATDRDGACKVVQFDQN